MEFYFPPKLLYQAAADDSVHPGCLKSALQMHSVTLMYFIFCFSVEYGKKPVLTALTEGLTIRNFEYLDKFPDKYAIDWTYQTIFRHHVIIITLLDTLNVAMQHV